ncbi:MAG TPA: histidine kinase [Candidatus Dormibacteraeota bacterium]|nr:histidine kinase [Candidatus Dormibacteraeota bacterium]
MPGARLRTLSLAGLLLALLGLAFAIYIIVMTPGAVPAGQKPGLLDAGLLFGGVEFAAVGFLITRRQPRNGIGWLLLAIGIFVPLITTSFYRLDARYAPAAFPAPDLIATVGTALGSASLGLLIAGFLVFPDGRLLSRRWLPFLGLGIVSDLMEVVSGILDPRVLGSGNMPLSASPLAQWMNSVGWFGLLLTGAGGVASMFLRYRRGTVEVKQQLKWVSVGVFATVATLWVGTATNSLTAPLLVLVVVLPATIGFAVLKYRLYDVDLVISRTVVYGALAIAIAAVYVGLVVGVGSIVGRGTGANLVLSLVATAIVALAFQPARARLQRAANRLVYGQRATPYEVLSDFSQHLAEAYASEELLPRMARVLGEGTTAERAEVWLRIEHELRRMAAWPEPGPLSPPPVAITGKLLPTLNAGRTVAVRHRGELLGALTISKRAGEALTPIEAKLLDDLATQAGLMLRNVGLTEALMEKVQELRASRQRLVTAQDQERRRLERNLHDGAQQHLVALRVKLGLAKRFVPTDPGKTTELLTQLESDADETLETLRDLARGIYPPLLADQGLATALAAQARKATLPVEVDAHGVGRYPQEVEAAVYFCCLEALQNVQKYAYASKAAVRLGAEDGALRFSVTDDGAGFDPKARRRGAGLQNMADRVDALGGALTITAAPGGGTTVTGTLPAISTT